MLIRFNVSNVYKVYLPITEPHVEQICLNSEDVIIEGDESVLGTDRMLVFITYL